MTERPRHRVGGRRWRRLLALVLADSDVCWLCGHPGADTADHVITVVERPDLEFDRANLRPAHHAPCPTCGVRCNMVRGAKPVPAVRTSRRW